MKRSPLFALAASTALVLAACSPGADDDDKDTSSDGDTTTVTFRLWDDSAVDAYQESFDAFHEQNPDITVKIETVSWDQYWDRLPRDLSSNSMSDIFWVNTSNFGIYVDNDNLISITDEIGDDHDEWTQSIVDLYTRNDELWGVPQIWDSIALYYNKDLVEEAGIDPADLTWAPEAGEGDNLLEAAQKLTTDSDGNTADSADFNANKIDTFGFNAAADLQNIYVNFLAENGASFQDDDDMFAFDTDEGVEAFQYLVDLVNEYHVAPPASETNQNGDYSRDLFVRGELGLFQSGPYSLRPIADNTDINWGIAPMVAGPEGRVSVVHGVAAVGNAGTDHLDETVEVLKWLGSTEGQMPLAEQGVSFPGAVDAQQAFVDYWADEDVDVQVFIDAAEGDTAAAPVGPAIGAGSNVIAPIFQDVFIGATSVEDGLKQAQEQGNAAME